MTSADPFGQDDFLNTPRGQRVAFVVTTPSDSEPEETFVNELVTPRHREVPEPRVARRVWRVLVIEALGPLTILGGIGWAFVQPYRIAFFQPDGKGTWDWLVQPPLLVVLVGVLFAMTVAPGLVDDLELHSDAADVDAPKG